MRESQYKEIGGVKYLCKMLPGDVAIELHAEFVQRIGAPALAIMSGVFKGATEDEEGNAAKTQVEDLMARAMGVFLQEMTPREVSSYMIRMMNGVEAEGVGELHDQAAFASHFRGGTGHMWQVFAWSMEVNFHDFFSVCRSLPLIGDLLAAARKALKGPISELGQPSEPTESASVESSSRQTVSTVPQTT